MMHLAVISNATTGYRESVERNEGNDWTFITSATPQTIEGHRWRESSTLALTTKAGELASV
jgi:hypothetical protein